MRSFELTDDLDLKLDGYGNIAIFDDRNSLAQDAACAVRTFYQEVKYYSTYGIKYQQMILGHQFSISELQHVFENEVRKQCAVSDVYCVLGKLEGNRGVGGIMFVTNSNNNKVEVIV